MTAVAYALCEERRFIEGSSEYRRNIIELTDSRKFRISTAFTKTNKAKLNITPPDNNRPAWNVVSCKPYVCKEPATHQIIFRYVPESP